MCTEILKLIYQRADITPYHLILQRIMHFVNLFIMFTSVWSFFNQFLFQTNGIEGYEVEEDAPVNFHFSEFQISIFFRSNAWSATYLWATWPPTSWTSSCWWPAKAPHTLPTKTPWREPWPTPWRRSNRRCFSGSQGFGRRFRRRWLLSVSILT